MEKEKLGVRQQLAISVFLSISIAALLISLTLYFLNKDRAYRDAVRQSEEMIQASALAFSQSMDSGDEVLLDALVHELQSKDELHITELYVIRPDGRIAAHSKPEEYGKRYKAPALLLESRPSSLSDVIEAGDGMYSVVSLLQARGRTLGALVVGFSSAHIGTKALSEVFFAALITIPVLVISGFFVLAWGKKMTRRLDALKERVLAIGRGEWGEPMEVSGSDEISTLTAAFNQMRSDIIGFMEKDARSAATITALNRDLTAQLEMVKRLKEQLAEENAALREEIRSRHNPGQIIGSKGSLARLMEQASQLSSLPVTVLITGESGTGKELLARYLHEAGSRAKGPFITVNCAALPATLFESELFGHEKGAFTGALALKKGKFEIADGGTLFLDEVGEIPVEAQAKLLRALQTGEVSRVGSEATVHADVRVLAATNRNLIEEVKAKRFRDDLYYRLKVVELTCPPLRERMEDLPALVQHFIEQYSRKLGKEVLGVSPSALELLAAYRWPGNIRELENMVARAVALATSKVLGPADFTVLEDSGAFAGKVAAVPEGPVDFQKLLRICGMTEDEFARAGLEGLLEKLEAIILEERLLSSKSQKEAAEALGLTPTKLHRLLKKYNIERHKNDA